MKFTIRLLHTVFILDCVAIIRGQDLADKMPGPIIHVIVRTLNGADQIGPAIRFDGDSVLTLRNGGRSTRSDLSSVQPLRITY